MFRLQHIRHIIALAVVAIAGMGQNGRSMTWVVRGTRDKPGRRILKTVSSRISSGVSARRLTQTNPSPSRLSLPNDFIWNS